MNNIFKNTLVFGLTLTAAMIIANAQPGTDSDPLISKGYIDNQVMPTIYERTTFKVVEIGAGRRLICGEGTEMIVRSGNAGIIATQKGGVVNVTAGVDLPNGSDAPSNSLLIIPVADGRGLLARTNLLVMVKGEYRIE